MASVCKTKIKQRIKGWLVNKKIRENKTIVICKILIILKKNFIYNLQDYYFI